MYSHLLEHGEGWAVAVVHATLVEEFIGNRCRADDDHGSSRDVEVGHITLRTRERMRGRMVADIPNF